MGIKMMHEHISLGGAPVVGFGLGIPFLGIIVGAVGGAALGKGVIGTASGAVIGGLAGGAGGIAIAELLLHSQVKR
jgi:hypothetical protein